MGETSGKTSGNGYGRASPLSMDCITGIVRCRILRLVAVFALTVADDARPVGRDGRGQLAVRARRQPFDGAGAVGGTEYRLYRYARRAPTRK